MTPEEQAAAIIADPAWSFTDNPTLAIAHASTRAATAQREGNTTRARYWTSVGLALCEAAGVEPGQVLVNLRDGQ
ncbi:MAG: hypothetical protein C0498_01705 [Anaerolinea sp.]|nr:hypothetical protein [Anaerolinea sp.]